MATRTLEGRIGALPKAALSVHVAISQVGLPLAGGLEAPQDDAASMKETLCAKIEPIGKNSVCSSGSIGVVCVYVAKCEVFLTWEGSTDSSVLHCDCRGQAHRASDKS